MDWGGKVAAWFGAVAAGSAALAALIIAKVQHLHGWPHVAFVALVVIASVSFVGLLLTGPPTAWKAWRNRRRISSRTSSPAGFRVEPRIRDKWIDLGVTNDSDEAAEFGASVEATVPEPAGRFHGDWPIRWTATDDERQIIDAHDTRYLQFGYAEVTPVEGEREFSGSISFRCVGRGGVSFNYENKDELARRVPAIEVTVRVYRVSPRLDLTFGFVVGLNFDNGGDRALPWVRSVSQCRNGDCPS